MRVGDQSVIHHINLLHLDKLFKLEVSENNHEKNNTLYIFVFIFT